LKILWRGVNHRINDGTRVLERAVGGREAGPREGARSTSTIAQEVEHTHPWVELDTNNEEDSRGERSGGVRRRRC
jgi:hypothetical protein